MLKIDLKKFLRDRCWFGWLYQNPMYSVMTGEVVQEGHWYRLHDNFTHTRIINLSAYR